jgi:hypothetical protein
MHSNAYALALVPISLYPSGECKQRHFVQSINKVVLAPLSNEARQNSDNRQSVDPNSCADK